MDCLRKENCSERELTRTETLVSVVKQTFNRTTIPYFLCMLLWTLGTSLPMALVVTKERDYFASRRAGFDIECETLMARFESGTPMSEIMPDLEHCKASTDDSLMWSTWSDFFSQSLLGFFLMPFIGAAGDIYGRKPFMILASFTNVLVALTLVTYQRYGLEFSWYYVAHALQNSISALPIGLAAVTDTCSVALRPTMFGTLLASASLGGLIGPQLAKRVHMSRTFDACLIITLINFFFAVILTETVLHKQGSDKEDLEQPLLRSSDDAPADTVADAPANTCADAPALQQEARSASSTWSKFVKQMPTLTGVKILLRNKLFRTLAVLVIVDGFVSEGMHDTLQLYLQQDPDVQLTTIERENLQTSISGAVTFTQFVLLPGLLAMFSEPYLLVLGAIFCMGQQVGIVLLKAKWHVYLVLILGSLQQLTFPAISTMKANGVGSEEQGQIQGALYGIQAVGKGLGPVSFNCLYQLYTKPKYHKPYYPQAPFVMSSCVAGVAVLVALKIWRDSIVTVPRNTT